MNVATSDADYAVLTASDTVRLERLLPGPAERVWRYLTDGELRRKWLASGDMAPHAGAGFELVWRNDELTDPPGHRPEGFGEEHRMQSTITACEPERLLAFTWGPGEVRFELEPRGDQVLLTVTHAHISDRRNMVMIGAGWHMHLGVLAARLDGTRPEPFWDGWARLREVYDRRIPA
ncbi:MAG: SRPBCC family protein [Lysobacter sp.]|nr:SRPBCC family protein [Lysobacter sp.]